jgi:hypothetical protein
MRRRGEEKRKNVEDNERKIDGDNEKEERKRKAEKDRGARLGARV